ncbi:hypothetical protein C7458_103436 [Williamsia muralis]|nr:hypothetical protein C7458_103436 [Williamsia marianensis]
MATQGHRLANGMSMTMVTVLRINQIDSLFSRLDVHAPELRTLRRRPAWPRRSDFSSQARGLDVTLSGFDSRISRSRPGGVI